MKFDRKTVDMLAGMPDEKLGALAALLAASKGLTQDGGLKADSARKLKEVMRNLSDGDIERISELIEIYKKN
ncbi:MAG: hypothetical protein IKG80_03560 [Clostridia bacterium]|nr:hypothetical protein [Clostridia bacterium]